MLIPKLLPIPFAENGRKNTIPDNRTSEMQAHLASFDTGFPAITMLPKQDGGLPPDGMDMNGILYDLSVHAVYQNKGGQYKFNAEYAESIDGYPKGAILLSDDEAKQYISVTENNKDNFNTSTSAKWKVISLADIDVLLNDKVSSQNVSEALNLKADKDRQIIAGNGLSGGGTLAANRTITLGTPTKITSSSTNSVTTTSHTHAIDSASTSVAGVVQLTNTINNSQTLALTPYGLTNNSVGNSNGKFMREGAYGVGGYNSTNDAVLLNDFSSGLSFFGDTSSLTSPFERAGALLKLGAYSSGQFQIHFGIDDRIRFRRSNSEDQTWRDINEFYTTVNTYYDSNGFLKDRNNNLNALTTNQVVQSTGTSTTNVMSQKAATDAINAKITGGSVVQSTGTSTTNVISQKGFTDALNFTYQDMTSQRSLGVTYTNNLSKPIDVYISSTLTSENIGWAIYLNGVAILLNVIQGTGPSGVTTTKTLSNSFRVPAGASYRVQKAGAAPASPVIDIWFEGR